MTNLSTLLAARRQAQEDNDLDHDHDHAERAQEHEQSHEQAQAQHRQQGRGFAGYADQSSDWETERKTLADDLASFHAQNTSHATPTVEQLDAFKEQQAREPVQEMEVDHKAERDWEVAVAKDRGAEPNRGASDQPIEVAAQVFIRRKRTAGHRGCWRPSRGSRRLRQSPLPHGTLHKRSRA